VVPKIGEIIYSIVGVHGAKEGIICFRIGQPAKLESLKAGLDMLWCKLERLFRHMTCGAASPIPMNTWKIDVEEGPSA